jgi:hypothetical protein
MAMNTLIALLLASLPLAAQDTLRFKDPAKNPELEGDVVAMTYKTVEVEVLVDGVRIKRTVDARDVAELIPRRSIDFTKAEEAAANGDFATAVQRFERVAGDARAGELLNQAAAIQVVRTHAAAGSHAAVVQSARALRARKKEGYYVGESYQAEVEAQLALPDVKAAAATVQAFQALANGLVAVDWVRDGDVLEARIKEAQGNPRAALVLYRKHAKDADAADACTRGELRCLTAIGDWPGLRRKADAAIQESLTKKNPDARTVVAAYTGRGDLEMNDGKPKEALLNYLQGALVQNRGEKSPEHEVALARSSIACSKMAAAEKSREAKDLHRSRARELALELAAAYPRSALKPDVDKAIGESR